VSDLIAIGMRGFAAVCPADSPLRGARAVFGSQGLWVRWCRSALVRECRSARVRDYRSVRVPECAGARVRECPSTRVPECARCARCAGQGWCAATAG